MNFIPQKQMDHAVLYRLFVYAQESDNYLTVGEIAALFDFPVSSKRIDLALQNLEADDNIDRRLVNARPASITTTGYTAIERGLMEENSFVFNYATRGDEWLKKQSLSIGGVPASDRIVSRKDNQELFEQITADLATIETVMATDNEVGAVLGDERDLIQGEFAAAKELVKQPRFRLRRAVELLIPALRYLAEKFSGAGIGEAAKHLIKLLIELF